MDKLGKMTELSILIDGFMFPITRKSKNKYYRNITIWQTLVTQNKPEC